MLMWSTSDTSMPLRGLMSTTRGVHVWLTVLQISLGMYMEDVTCDRKHDTIDDNISTSFSVSFS